MYGWWNYVVNIKDVWMVELCRQHLGCMDGGTMSSTFRMYGWWNYVVNIQDVWMVGLCRQHLGCMDGGTMSSTFRMYGWWDYVVNISEYGTLVVTILGIGWNFECYHFTLIYFRLATI